MSEPQTTLSEFILDGQRRAPGATGVFSSLLNGLRLSCMRISQLIARGAIDRHSKTSAKNAAASLLLRTLERRSGLAATLSDAMTEPRAARGRAYGPYLLAFDPLDGSSSVDVNVSVGSVFSILRAPAARTLRSADAFMQRGTQQVAAGYAIYGPSTVLVLTVGHGVHGFTLDHCLGEFVLTHPAMTVAASTHEFAVNTSNARFWEPPVQRYVDECVQGDAGPRGGDFNMRWIASLVAEVHRILIRGGLFMYPADTRAGLGEGRLRLLYEANPIAMLLEQAGGAASTGRGRILEVAPRELHQKVPVFFGSRDEVERVERYHREHDEGLDSEFRSPLFNERSLFPRRDSQ
jgi:fructose-1,6-bisphosphatase